MKNNGPVTNREIPVKAGDEIVSSTDLAGTIRFCNETFCEIAGYTHDELIDQPHNILRHPDMPADAFAMLWDALKKGDAWMGVVKNRCKNGDHYWVDAYITPVSEHGKVVGYESVRVRPERSWVERAETVYARLQAGKGICSPALKLWQKFGAAIIAGAVSFLLMALAARFQSKRQRCALCRVRSHCPDHWCTDADSAQNASGRCLKYCQKCPPGSRSRLYLHRSL